MRHAFGLQNLIVLGLVVLAAAYLRRSLTRKSQSHADGACGKCGSADKKGDATGAKPA